MPRFFYQNTTCTPEEFFKLQLYLPTDKNGTLIKSYIPKDWAKNGQVQFDRIDKIFDKLNYEKQSGGCFSVLSAIMLGRKDQSGKPYSYEDVMDPTKLVSEKNAILEELEKTANENDPTAQSEAFKKFDEALILGTDRMATHFEQRLSEVLRGKNPMAALMDPDLYIEADIVRNLVTDLYGNTEFKKRAEKINIKTDSGRSLGDLSKKIGELLIPVIGYPRETLNWYANQLHDKTIDISMVNTILGCSFCIQNIVDRMKNDPQIAPSDALDGHIGVDLIDSESIDQIEKEISKKEDAVDKKEYEKIKPLLQLTETINQNPITRRGAVTKLFDGTLCEKITLNVKSNEMPRGINLDHIESIEITAADESKLVDAAFSYFPKDSALEMAKIPFGEEIKGSSDNQYEPNLWSTMVENLNKFNQKREEVKTAGGNADDLLLFEFQRAASALMKSCKDYVLAARKSGGNKEFKSFVKKAEDLFNHIRPYRMALADSQKAANNRRWENYFVHPFSDEVLKDQMDTLKLLHNKVESIEKKYNVRDDYKTSKRIKETIKALKEIQADIEIKKANRDYSFETTANNDDQNSFSFGNEALDNYNVKLNELIYFLNQTIETAGQNRQIAKKEAFEECKVWISPWLVQTKCSITNKLPDKLPEEQKTELIEKREKAARDKQLEHEKEQEEAFKQEQQEQSSKEITDEDLAQEFMDSTIAGIKSVTSDLKATFMLPIKLKSLLNETNIKPTGCVEFKATEFFEKKSDLIKNLGDDLATHFRMYCLTHGVTDDEMLSFAMEKPPKDIEDKIRALKPQFFEMLTNAITENEQGKDASGPATQALVDHYVNVINYLDGKLPKLMQIDSPEKLVKSTKDIAMIMGAQSLFEQGLRMGVKESDISGKINQSAQTEKLASEINQALKKNGKDFEINNIDIPFRPLDMFINSISKTDLQKIYDKLPTFKDFTNKQVVGDFELNYPTAYKVLSETASALKALKELKEIAISDGIDPNRPFLNREKHPVRELDEHKLDDGKEITIDTVILETVEVLHKMTPPTNETVTNLRNLSNTLLGSKWSLNAIFGKKTKEFTDLSNALEGLNKQLDGMAKSGNGTSARSVPIADFEKYVKSLEIVQQATDDYMNYKYGNLNSDFAGSRYESASKLADLVNKELKQCREKLSLMGVTRAVTADAYVEKGDIETLKNNYHKTKDGPTDPKLGARPMVEGDNVKLQDKLNWFYDDMRTHSSLRNHFSLGATADAVKRLQSLSENKDKLTETLKDPKEKEKLMDSVITLVAYGIIRANPDIANRDPTLDELKQNISNKPNMIQFAQYVNATNPNVNFIRNCIDGVLSGTGEPFVNKEMADELRKDLNHPAKEFDGLSIGNNAPEKDELGKS